MVLVAAFCTQPGIEAACCVHGLYDTADEAQRAIRERLTQTEGTEAVDAFIVDDVGQWLPVVDPRDPSASRFLGEVDEVGTVENVDPSQGRAGSVCDLRRSRPPPAMHQPEDASSPPPPRTHRASEQQQLDPSSSSRCLPTDVDVAKRREVRRQHNQLDDLLQGPLPDGPLLASGEEAERQYASLRGRYAMLRAFERKLRTLCGDARTKREAAGVVIQNLDERHPEYRTEYESKYFRALRESGMEPEDVPFIQYLRADYQEGENSSSGCSG